jgi:hypothetical protein
MNHISQPYEHILVAQFAAALGPEVNGVDLYKLLANKILAPVKQAYVENLSRYHPGSAKNLCPTFPQAVYQRLNFQARRARRNPDHLEGTASTDAVPDAHGKEMPPLNEYPYSDRRCMPRNYTLVAAIRCSPLYISHTRACPRA